MSFMPLNMSIFSKEKNSEFLPKCCKMALFALQFSKIFGGACPRTPLEKFRLRRLLCPSPEKNPTFSQNLNGSTAIYYII